MSNIRLYDPLSIDPMSDIVQGLMRAFGGNGTDIGRAFKLDVSESDDAYTVVAEVPGAKKEDIHISVDHGMVTIATKTEAEHEEKQGERVIRRERYRGNMPRAFTLGTNIAESKVDASYEDGVLRLKLPKAQSSPQRRIEIR